MGYIMPYEVALDILLFLFGEHSFFDPSDALPALELDQDLIRVDRFDKVEEDVSLDGVSGEVEGLIDLDKGTRHDTNIS